MSTEKEDGGRGGSGKRWLADGSWMLRNAIGKPRRLRLPLPPMICMESCDVAASGCRTASTGQRTNSGAYKG